MYVNITVEEELNMFETLLVTIIDGLIKSGKSEPEALSLVTRLLASVMSYDDLQERLPIGVNSAGMS